MVRKRLDDRIRTLLEVSIANHHRSFLVIVGDQGKNQIPQVYQLLSQTTGAATNANANNTLLRRRQSVLWCYKKELGFSTHRQKRLKKLQKQAARGLLKADDASADTFELFLSQTDITWCYYKDSSRILGTTHDLLVLQDFSSVTPNVLCRTMETVRGGGCIVLLLRTVQSLTQLYHLAMDVHQRYRTSSSSDIVPRFNERFLLSLAQCERCLVCDDEWNVVPLSKRVVQGLVGRPAEAPPETATTESNHNALAQLQHDLADTPHVGALMALAVTLDQGHAVVQCLDACADSRAGGTVVALTAARGRGKSAALGLCLAGAVALGYAQIAVTAPAPENLVSVFQLCLKGLQALEYQEQVDYTVQYDTSALAGREKSVLAIRLHRNQHTRQVIQYIPPMEKDKFASAEIVAIDEAAAIPLPTVKGLLAQQSDRLCFLSSTVNGYEGTGRALSLKLIQELRNAKGDQQLSAAAAAADSVEKRSPSTGKRDAAVHETRYAAAAQAAAASTSRLREIELKMPIRYAEGDPVEKWLNKLLCLDCGSSHALENGAPAPADCELYSVDRDALFSYHKLSESFLQKLMGLYTSAHYKNSPNDLQMLSDAPAHRLFVLLSPSAEENASTLPDVLAVVQVALEGQISRKTVEAQLARGQRSAGDLIPWTIAQQFGDSAFGQLSGARIVRIAVHPTVQGMGYGSRAMELLYRYYNGEMVALVGGRSDEPASDDDDDDMGEEDPESGDEDDDDENEANAGRAKGILAERIKPRKQLPPLLLPLTDVKAPQLDWIGTSFGLTLPLHKFWRNCGMKLLYLRQTKNDLTGEHSAIMLRALPKPSKAKQTWLASFASDTRRRLVTLYSGCFREMSIRLAMSLLDNLQVSDGSDPDATRSPTGKISADELDTVLTPHDRKRLGLYGRNLCDHHLVSDIVPVVSRLFFLGRLGDLTLSAVQKALLCGIGLQTKTIDQLVKDLDLPSHQVLAMFNKAVRKISLHIDDIIRDREKKALLNGSDLTKAEALLEKMQDVTEQTLEADTREAAKDATVTLRAAVEDALPPEIRKDPELMQYVVKGSKEDWDKALEDRQLRGGEILVKSGEKRKPPDTSFVEEMKPAEKSKRTKKSKKKKRKQ